MSDAVTPLLRDLLAWVAIVDRPYEDVMEAWRTSCPRLPVWEEAVDRGLVAQVRDGRAALVRITGAGRTFLAAPGP